MSDEEQVTDYGQDVAADSDAYTPADVELEEELDDDELQDDDEIQGDDGDGEESESENADDGSEDDNQPASPVGMTPQELDDLKRKAVRAEVFEELMKARGNGNPQDGTNPTGVPAPVKTDEAAEAMAAARKRFEDGDYEGGLAAIQTAMAKHTQRNNEAVKNTILSAILPLYQQQQNQLRQSAWVSFCQNDPDLKDEYESAVKGAITETPLRDAMTEALNSGLAGNWQGALIIAKTRVKPAKQSTVVKKTALAASTMSRPSKAVSTVNSIDRGLSNEDYLKRCLAETDRELGIRKKKRR